MRGSKNVSSVRGSKKIRVGSAAVSKGHFTSVTVSIPYKCITVSILQIP